MQIMNEFVVELLQRIGATASQLAEINHHSTLSSRDVQTAARLVLPGELAKHAVSEGVKAVTKFYQKAPGSKRGLSSSAGLQFPVTRIRNYLRHKWFALRISKSAPIYLAAVAEYMVAEVIELSGNAARDNRKACISPRHIFVALVNDEELGKYLNMKRTVISGGGVIPNINSSLFPKKNNNDSYEF